MYVLYFAIFALVKAEEKAEEVVKFPLGPLDVDVEIGSPLPLKYQPLSGIDMVASVKAKKLLEEVFANATEEVHGIPALEPFYLDELPLVTVDHSLINVVLKLRHLNIIGISTTTVDEVETRLKNGHSVANFTGRSLQIDVDYEAKVKAGLPLTYKGHATVRLNGVKTMLACGIVKKRYNKAKVFQLDGLKAQAHVMDAQVEIDEDLWETVTGVLTPEEMVEALAPAALKTAKTEVNQILRKFSIKTIMNYFQKN